MKIAHLWALGFLVIVGCGKQSTVQSGTLAEARKGFTTKLASKESANQPLPQPPTEIFRIVRYDSPVGKLGAYLTPNNPKDGKKRPAIIWITGGDCNTIDDVWQDAPPSNDQTASAFRKAGIVMMFPSLRGGNDNPGFREGFFGEVDDILAAADFLAKQDHVDPQRIYLGGHSTGGTLVLLAAECSNRFRAVFSFGPAHDVRAYGPEFRFLLPFDRGNAREADLRSPGLWLNSIDCPVFVFEGTVDGNLAALQSMKKGSTNPKIQFLPIDGGNHFNILAPTTRLIAQRILRDDGPECNLTFNQEELRQ